MTHEEKIKAAEATLAEMAALLDKAGIPWTWGSAMKWKRICIPDEKDWDYSIICHPGSYGFPTALEIGWYDGAKSKDIIDVKGWLAPDEVIEEIQEMGV